MMSLFTQLRSNAVRNAPHRRPCYHRSQRKTRGVALICAMVALVIVLSLGASMLRALLQTQQRTRLALYARQAELLVQSGLERAAYHLRDDQSYKGEKWHLSAAEIAGPFPGNVEIVVSRKAASDSFQVQITAQYPDAEGTSVRRSRQFVVSPSRDM